MIEMGILCKLIACKKRKKLKYNFRVKSWAEVIKHGPLTYLERNRLLPKPTLFCLTIIVFLSDQTFDSEMWILKIIVSGGFEPVHASFLGFLLSLSSLCSWLENSESRSVNR